ncbi:MAG: SIS domain-containing protein [Rhodocyclaceae bacterium]|nr:SIS domain-containing protein [Rhodocyclaceae bacterium]
MTTPAQRTQSLFQESLAVKRALLEGEHIATLVRMSEMISDSIAAGGKILFCGNGGSAADAQHLAAELLVRLRPQVNRQGIPALALAMDSSTLTACANDYSFDALYERMVETLGNRGDVLLGITTSGKSPNIIRALKTARLKGMHALAFLGCGGGPALADCDLAFVVPSAVTGRIQEAHIMAGHALMELIEDRLLELKHIRPTM